MCILDKPTNEEVTFITHRAIVCCDLRDQPQMNTNPVIFHHSTATRCEIYVEKLI